MKGNTTHAAESDPDKSRKAAPKNVPDSIANMHAHAETLAAALA